MNVFSKTGNFFREVREEILKCTRPSFAELKESTMVILLTMVVLGVLIFFADYVINFVLRLFLS
jgi:preprotein translocase SecE subunit